MEFGVDCDWCWVELERIMIGEGWSLKWSYDWSGVEFEVDCDWTWVEFGVDCNWSWVEFGVDCDWSGVDL